MTYSRLVDEPQKSGAPGWYRHPEMVNTLCYWDGEAWTDKVQPVAGDASNSVASGVLKAVAVLVAIAAVIAVLYLVATANDDLECATRGANSQSSDDC